MECPRFIDETKLRRECMKRLLLFVGVLAIVGACSIGRVEGQEQGEKAVFADANHAQFTAMPESNGKVSMARGFGATPTLARMRRSPSLCRDTTRVCTRIRTTSGLWGSRRVFVQRRCRREARWAGRFLADSWRAQAFERWRQEARGALL